MENSKNSFDYLNNEISLLNSKIEKIKIFSENELLIISVSLLLGQQRIIISFEDVVEYGFYHNDKHIFYNVEDYKFKFIEEKQEFYISFDPYPGTEQIDNRDGDFIKSKRIKYTTATDKTEILT